MKLSEVKQRATEWLHKTRSDCSCGNCAIRRDLLKLVAVAEAAMEVHDAATVPEVFSAGIPLRAAFGSLHTALAGVTR